MIAPLPRRSTGAVVDLSFWFPTGDDRLSLQTVVDALSRRGAQPNGEMLIVESNVPFQTRKDLPLKSRPFEEFSDLHTAITEGVRVVECLLRNVFAGVTMTATDVFVGSDFGPAMANGHPITISLPEGDVDTDAAWQAATEIMFSVADETHAAYAAACVEQTMPAPQSLDIDAANMLRTFFVGHDWAGPAGIERIANQAHVTVTRLKSGVCVRTSSRDHHSAGKELARAAARWLHEQQR